MNQSPSAMQGGPPPGYGGENSPQDWNQGPGCDGSADMYGGGSYHHPPHQQPPPPPNQIAPYYGGGPTTSYGQHYNHQGTVSRE